MTLHISWPSIICALCLAVASTAHAALSIVTSSVPNGTQWASYGAYPNTVSITAGGGTAPYAWSVSAGVLPAGIQLDESETTFQTTLSGTPGLDGNFIFTVSVTDATTITATYDYTISIAASTNADPLRISMNDSGGGGAIGSVFSQQIMSYGTCALPLTWSLSGTVLAGITIEAASTSSSSSFNATLIHGTPVTAGTFAMTIEAVDAAGQTDSVPYVITVSDPAVQFQFVTGTTLPDAVIGQDYAAPIEVTGGTGPYTWDLPNFVWISGNWVSLSSERLPDGFSPAYLGFPMSAIQRIEGTATSASATGAYNFTLGVTDSTGAQKQQMFFFNVGNGGLAGDIGPATLPDAILGTQYDEAITAPAIFYPLYFWYLDSGTLPSGLDLDTSTIIEQTTLSGMPDPAAAGRSFTFTVKVVDSVGNIARKEYTVAILDPNALTPTIAAASLADGTESSAYSANITAVGGLAPFTWSLVSGSLPDGLVLDTAATGASVTLSGTPARGMGNLTFSFTIRVIDSNGVSDDQVFTLKVLPAPPAIAFGGAAGGGCSLTAHGGNNTGMYMCALLLSLFFTFSIFRAREGG